MKNIANKPLSRLCRDGLLASIDDVSFLEYDAVTGMRCYGEFSPLLQSIHKEIPSPSLLLAKPREPYLRAINALSCGVDTIQAEDSESKMLLGALPVVKTSPLETNWAHALVKQRALVIPNWGIIVSAPNLLASTVIFSTACFAIKIKFLVDFVSSPTSLLLATNGKASETIATFLTDVKKRPARLTPLMRGIFTDLPSARKAMVQAGRRLVTLGLVNASFGNISYALADALLISATGSFLDDLEEAMVLTSLYQKNRQDKLASSELPAHRKILATGKARALLHGHPTFVVALSLFEASAKHTKVKHPPTICGVPVVKGKTGGGRCGLDKALAPVLTKSNIAIAAGHGVFCTGERDFHEPLQNMLTLENACCQAYQRLITAFG